MRSKRQAAGPLEEARSDVHKCVPQGQKDCPFVQYRYRTIAGQPKDYKE